MKIEKIKNDMGAYDFQLSKDGKKLTILYAGNLDLYMMLGNGDLIPDDCNLGLEFDITKEKYEIYRLFDDLYNEIIDGEVFKKDKDEIDTEYEHDFKDTYAYEYLVDENKDIYWISDDGPRNAEDAMRISKLDEDTYRLTFFRNDIPMDCGFKNAMNITVRFRNSGSYYSPFNCVFMRMYQKMQSIDPKYHQIHMEELEYVKKLKRY